MVKKVKIKEDYGIWYYEEVYGGIALYDSKLNYLELFNNLKELKESIKRRSK